MLRLYAIVNGRVVGIQANTVGKPFEAASVAAFMLKTFKAAIRRRKLLLRLTLATVHIFFIK